MQPEEKPANSTNPVEGQVNVIIAAVQEESRNQTTDTSTSLENNVFTWKNVKNSVPVGTRKERHEKVLLDGISGQIVSGECIAIMGGSGAGKSTLLNTLAGRIANNVHLEGEITLNGAPRDEARWKLQCAYVEQDDVLFDNLTVFETLLYSARLRLPSSMSKEEKINRVNIVIGQLGLEGCRDTRIGNEIERGISGGERKRVSIGIELVTNPKILFLDEPTSGLDAFNAFNAMETLKKLAKQENKIILVTIHQPRTDILELFDKIILLSMGKMVWFGPTHDCIEHFGKVGYPLPPKTNPSDFFLDTITVDRRSPDLFEKSTARIDKFVQAYQELNVEIDATPKNSIEEGANVPVKKERFSLAGGTRVEWPSTWLGEFLVLSDRNLTNDFRDKATLGASIGQNIFVAIIICALFSGVKNDAAGIQNRLGCFFFLCLNLTFGIIGPNMGKFPDQKRIIKRERAAGSYRSSSAFLSKIASSVPLILIGNIILAVPVYWAVGLAATVQQFFTFLLIVFVHSNTANNLGFLIGASVPTATVGQIVMPLIIIVFMLFGGLLINLDSITVVLRWIQWVSLISYTYKAFAMNEFTSSLSFTCSEGQKCYANGVQVVETFSLNQPGLWYSILINGALAIAFCIAGLFVFHRTSAPLQKLK